MTALTKMVLDVVLLVFMLVLGIPLPYCFCGAFAFMAVTCGLNVTSLLVWGATQMSSLTLIAGPMFILCGTIMTDGRIIERLLDVTDMMFRKIRGSLGYIVIITCGFIGALSGSGFTGVAAVGPALTPRMTKAGYPIGFTAALMTASTVLGVLIPPSVPMIIFGWVTGVSVLACFLSTVFPAIILMILLGILNFFEAKRSTVSFEEYQKRIEEARALELKNGGHQFSEDTRTTRQKLVGAIPALCLPIFILGGIYGGAFTPTEAAAMATAASLIIALFIYRTMDFKSMCRSLKKSGSSIGSIMTMTYFCLLLSQAYVMLDMPKMVTNFFMSFTDDKNVILLLIFVLLVIMGMIINDTSAIVLCAPILYPICQAYGISGVQLAAIMVTTLGLGGLTPPYASTLYLSMRVCGAKFEEIMPPDIKIIVFGYVPTCLLVLYVPALSTWLPTVLNYM